MTASGVFQGPGHRGVHTLEAQQAHCSSGRGNPAKPPPRGPCVEPGRGQRATRRSRPHSWSDVWVSQCREDWRGVSVLGWKAQRGTHSRFFSCKTGRKGNGKNKRWAPSAQRRKMEKTHCTWDALFTVIPRGRRNHPVLKCEVGLTSPVSQSVLEHAAEN